MQTSDIWVFVDVSVYNLHFVKYFCTVPILVAMWSKAWVCGCSLAGITGLNPAGRHDFVLGVVLSGRGLCVRLITCPEVVLSVVSLSVIVKPQ